MPDFLDEAIERLKAKREQDKATTATMKPLDKLRNHDKEKAENIKREANPFTSRKSDFTRATYGSGEEADRSYKEQTRTEDYHNYMTPQVGQGDYNVDQNGNRDQTPSTIARSFLATGARSVKAGTGELISSYGNLTNILFSGLGTGFGTLGDFDKMAFDGNIASRFLNEAGDGMAEDNAQWVPDDINNPEFKISTFLNPEFWAVHGGKFLPQLAEIAATAEVGKGVKFLVEKGAGKLAGGLIEKTALELGKEVAEESAKKGFVRKMIGETAVSTTESFSREGFKAGAQNIVRKGSGLLGATMTDKGKLTKGFGELVQTAGSGAFTNLSVGLKNAGEVYQTYGTAIKTDDEGNPILDEKGNTIPLFSKEELGDMAAGVFQTNLQYMAADMLSWGLTYGKGLDMVKGFPAKVAKATGATGFVEKVGAKVGGAVVNSFDSKVGKIASGMVVNGISPFLKKTGKLGVKMTLEGAEETIQESFEEWSKMKAYADVHGSLKGYGGPGAKKLSQDYNTEDGFQLFNQGGFWEFYKGDDSTATQVIALALGAAAGGAFNIGEVFNKQAETAHKFKTRYDLINSIHNTPEGKAAQQAAIYHQMAELVMEDKGALFAETLANLHTDKKITDDEFKRHARTYDEIAANYELIKDLKMGGKKAFMRAVGDEVHFNDKIEEATETFIKDRDALNSAQQVFIDQETDPKKKKQLQKELETKQKELETDLNKKIIPLSQMIAQVKEQQKNLVLNKDAKPVEYKVSFEFDENTGQNTKAVYTPVEREFGMSEQEKIDAQNKIKDEFGDIDQKWEGAKKKGKEILSKTKQKVNDIWESLGKSFNKDAENPQSTPQPETAKGQTTDTEKGNSTNPTENQESEIDFNEEVDFENENGVVEKRKLSDLSLDDGLDVIASQKLAEQSALNDEKLPIVEDPDYKDLIKIWKADNDKIEKKYEKKSDAFKSLKRNDPKNEPVAGVHPTNDKIKVVTKEPGFTNADYKAFQKDGTINSNVIAYLAVKKMTGAKLTNHERNVMGAFGPEIDREVKLIKASFDEMMRNENVAEDEKEIVNNQLLGKGKEQKSLTDKNSDPEFSDEPITAEDIEEDPFADGRLMKDTGKDVDRPKGLIRSILDLISGAQSASRKFKAKADNMLDDFGTTNFNSLAESIVVGEVLNKIYPDQNINVYTTRNLARVVGEKALGYTLGAQIYIQENKWNQGNTLMHEVAHIYYALNKDTPPTRAFLNYLLKDKKLLNRVLKDYDDSIQYRLVKSGDIVYKRELIGDTYDLASQEAIDAKIEKLIQEKKIEVIPMEEQEVIADELFVAGLEGSLGNRYSKFFEEKPSGDEIQRQFYAKKWWNSIKEKGQKFSQPTDRQEFFRSLSSDEQTEFNDTLEGILDAFSGEIKGKDVSAGGRAARIMSDNKNISSRIDQIEREIALEAGKMMDDNLFIQNLKKNPEEVMDSVDFETMFDADDRLAYSNKLMSVVTDFTRRFNKGISILNKYNSSRANWRNSNYLDADILRYQLSEIAKVSYSGSDFIRRLRDSEYYEITEFMNHLDNSKRDDVNLMLQTLHWHEQNTSSINAMKVFVNGQNVSKIESTLNNREKTIFENTINNITRPFMKSERESDSRYETAYQTLISSATNIKRGKYSQQDIYNVLNYFAGDQLNTAALLEANRINYDGKVQNLTSVIVKFVTSENGLLGNGFKNQYKTGPEIIYQTSNKGLPMFGIYGKDGRFKSSIRTLVTNLINENRKFTSNYTTIHADGTQHQARIIDNYLSRGFKNMKRDAKILTKAEFFDKYSTLNRGKKGSQSNKFLEFLYNKVSSIGDIDLVEYAGIENQYNDGKTSMLKSADAVTERISQFMIFANTQSKSSYMMDLGRFSDSSRAYYVEAPRTDTADVFSIENGKVKFTKKAVLENIFNTHKSMGYKGEMMDMKSDIEQSIRDQINFINDNIGAFEMDPKFSTVIEKGKLNAKGQMLVANFEVNQIINGTNFTEIFFPSFKMVDSKGENQLIKRAKSAASPMFAFPNAHVEPIYLEDIQAEGLDGFDTTDAGFFILQEDADKFRKAGGTLMPLGNAFKIIQTGVEHYNENTKGQNIYNKGYATVINDEVVLKNPELKGAYEILKRRKQQYKDKYGDSSQNLLDGMTHHIPYIVPISANKAKETLKGVYDTNIMSYESLNAMAERNDFSEADAVLDKFHHDSDGEFVGVSAQNFGIQQVMDIDKNYTNTSVQLVKSLTSGMGINENQEEVIELLDKIKDLSEKQIESVYDIIMNGDSSDIRDFFMENVDKEKIDQVQRALIFDDSVSLTTPAVREIVKNTFANVIKQGGLKLKTPGNVLREKPSLYKNQYRTSSDLNATSGSDALKFYQQNSDGTYSKGEAVIPESMMQDGKKYHKITPREYLADNGKSLEQNLADAKSKAASRKVKYGKVFDAQDNHIGYYVEGDSIIATRIPSHGQQSTGVFEVVDFTGETGNNIQLPNEFKQIVGSDNDGDQIFVQHKGRGTNEWNDILDRIEKLYLNPNIQEELRQGIETKADVDNALDALVEVYGENNSKFILPFSSNGRQLAFKDTMIAKANVGLAANLHTTLRMFGNYNVALTTPIAIDGVYADQFMDVAGESVTIKSAKLFNIILDNAKNGNAEKLGINTNTIAMAMILSNLNFGLDKVAIILNHPMVKRYSELKDNNTSVFNKDEKYNVMKVLREEFKINASNKNIYIDTATIDKNDTDIYNLLVAATKIESETSEVGAVLSIHNNMTVNAFEIENILKKFDDRVSNSNEKSELTFPEDFAQNPIVQNYRNVLVKNQDIQKKLDPIYSGQLHEIYEEITGLSTKEMSKENHKTLNNAIEVFHTAQILGMNNIPREKYESLVDPKSDQNIYARLNEHIADLRKEVSYFDAENPRNSVNKLQNNLLLTKGINFNYSGAQKYIGLNSDFHGNMMDAEVRSQMIREFAELPSDLRNDLIIYDLMQTGWKGFNSLFPLFPQGTKMRISNNSGAEFNNTQNQLSKLRYRLIMNNPELFSSYENIFKYDKDGDRMLNSFLATESPGLNALFSLGKPFMFRTKNRAGAEVMIKFKGFSAEEQVELNNIRETSDPNLYYTDTFLPRVMKKLSPDALIQKKAIPKLDYITIPKSSDNTPEGGKSQRFDYSNDPIVDEIINREPEPKNPLITGGRAQRRDYYNFTETMDRKTFDHVMEWLPSYDESRRESMYRSYLEEKAKADELKSKVNAETVKDLSNEELLNLFDGDVIPDSFGGGIGFGNRDKFAYSEIIEPIIKELATRAATDQTKLTGREYDGNDISILKKYFMTNNVPSNHPAVQNVVRRMEVEYKKFLKERSKYVGKINDATDQLYQEQLGFSPNKKGFRDTISVLKNGLFADKEAMYKQLYGPLIEYQEVTRNNQVVMDMKYKGPERVAAEHKAGLISDAQLNFYNVTREVSEEMKEFVLGDDPGKSRTDYIPHVAPANLEILSRRGLLGLMVNAKTVDEKIYDVRMDFKNPISGEMMKGVTFKNIEDIYNNLSKNSNGSKYAIEFVRLKNKAIQFNRKGVNEDGTPIRQSQVEISTALGDVFMDRFSNSRSIKASDLPTLDLNKAFTDYAHATLFQHGNSEFQGFKKMVPVIDGVLAQADLNKDKNVSEYLDKVWKQYFIGGRKQDVLPNLAAFEAVGLTTDKIVDYITKGSLVYWLGFKGLAMGAGLYAIGNVLVGKFNNLIDVGGRKWLEGEKRFWLGPSGKFDIRDPFKGWRESQAILKNTGFMDINIYDDVNIDNKNSVEKTLVSLALMPMSYSEKWIQGVHFLGKLDEDQWNALASGETMDPNILTEIEDSIKQFHGKGYTPTDQRMIQMYSWGRAMMQFNRYIPTMFNTLFGKKDIDIYGKKTMGTYTAVYETIQKGITGVWTPRKFRDYYINLEDGEKKKLTTGLMSLGLISGLAAVNQFSNNAVVDKLISDSHIVLDTDRLAGRLVPRSVLAIDDIF